MGNFFLFYHSFSKKNVTEKNRNDLKVYKSHQKKRNNLVKRNDLMCNDLVVGTV